MTRHFMLYWPLKLVNYRYYGEPLTSIAHDHLRTVAAGDVVWVVTLRAGDLFLAGRMLVADVVDMDAESSRPVERLRAARWVAVGHHDMAEPMQLVNLNELGLTFSLRFVSVADRLRMNRRGKLNVLSLVHLRRLTDESAALLTYTWYGNDGALEDVDFADDAPLYVEGRRVVRRQVTRQRNPALVQYVKDEHMALYGDLRCAVCDMSFREVYGDVGAGYIEVHHPEPMADADDVQVNDAEDMVLLCANCHRMAHRKSPPYRVAELRRIVQRQRQNRP